MQRWTASLSRQRRLGNSFVDELAEAEATKNRVGLETRKYVKRLFYSAVDAAKWLGRVTLLANAWPDGEGNTRRDSQADAKQARKRNATSIAPQGPVQPACALEQLYARSSTLAKLRDRLAIRWFNK